MSAHDSSATPSRSPETPTLGNCDVGGVRHDHLHGKTADCRGWRPLPPSVAAGERTTETAIVDGMWRCGHGHYNLASPDVCAYCDEPREPKEGDVCANCEQVWENHGRVDGEGATCPDRSGMGFEFAAASSPGGDALREAAEAVMREGGLLANCASALSEPDAKLTLADRMHLTERMLAWDDAARALRAALAKEGR